MKKNPHWEKIFANHLSDKELVSRINFRNSLNSTVKKQTAWLFIFLYQDFLLIWWNIILFLLFCILSIRMPNFLVLYCLYLYSVFSYYFIFLYSFLCLSKILPKKTKKQKNPKSVLSVSICLCSVPHCFWFIY